jgi:hypothetical protein
LLARFQAPDAPYYSSEPYKNILALAEHVVTTDIPIDPIADIVFKAKWPLVPPGGQPFCPFYTAPI